tara:strand:+ start:2858 stop:3742 length:885 start_codon:yes stop_codon:yes gene_type:complete
MSWYEKHAPKELDDFICNKKVVGYLKNMIKKKLYTHFILSGDHGSGKRSLIKVFLKTVTIPRNTLWLNHLSLKTIESKDKLNSFLTSKINEDYKWLIIENLHKMSNQFLYTLYNILSSEFIIVCVLESCQSVDLSAWAIKFQLNPPSQTDLSEIAKQILKLESCKYYPKIVETCIECSNTTLCSFLFFLETNYIYQKDLTSFSKMTFSYDVILNSDNLRERIHEIYRLECVGYSHMDIAIQLYRYVSSKSEDIECAIHLGNAVEHLSHFEHDPYYLYSTMAKIYLCNIGKEIVL